MSWQNQTPRCCHLLVMAITASQNTETKSQIPLDYYLVDKLN